MLSKSVQLAGALVGAYVSYTGYVYTRSQMEIQQRQQIYKNLNMDGLMEDKVKLVDPRFLSLRILGRYENPFPEYRIQTLFEFFVMRLEELFSHGRRGGLPVDPEMLKKALPVAKPDLKLLSASNRGEDAVEGYRNLPKLHNRLSYTWLGQSCGLLQISSLSFLTDPLFSDYLVNKYVGPKRYTPAPIGLDALMKTLGGAPEYILVSHDHPDHLDDVAITKIGNRSKWIVPKGIGQYLRDRGVTNLVELNWWDRVSLDMNRVGKADLETSNYEVVCLPAMHWGGRNLIDSNCRLWCSLMVLRDGKAIFFHGGDTGYTSELFKKIGSEFGPVKLAALPIGQYCPAWHQRPRHTSPSESIQIMKDLSCHKMIGVHWGTFVLSSENYLEPAALLASYAKKKSMTNSIVVPQPGRTMVMDLSKMDFEHDDKSVEDGNSVVFK